MQVKHRIDEIYTEYPFYGSRRICVQLRREGLVINRKAVQRYMREMGIEGIAPGPNLSRRNLAHRIYPYLLRGLQIKLDNIITERLWRTIKYEEVYLQDYASPKQARDRLTKYLSFYNHQRPHQSLNYRTLAELYFTKPVEKELPATKKGENRTLNGASLFVLILGATLSFRGTSYSSHHHF